jgi:hypothetical protein
MHHSDVMLAYDVYISHFRGEIVTKWLPARKMSSHERSMEFYGGHGISKKK